ncbi:MAG: hypothetical protein ABI321_10650 [Polyangia bacterium]
MRPLVVLSLICAPLLALAAPTPIDVLIAYKREVVTQLEWTQHKIDADQILVEIRAGDCSHAFGREGDCAKPESRARLIGTIEGLITERHHVAYTREQTMVPMSLEQRLKDRIVKLDSSIAKLRAGKSRGVYCDGKHTKLDLGDGCYDLGAQ